MRSSLAVLALLLLLPAMSRAQLAPELAPRELEGEPGTGSLPFQKREALPEGDDESAELVGELRHLKIRGEEEGELFRRTQDHPSRSLSFDGLKVPSEPLDDLLWPFLGQPLTEQGLDRLIDTVLRYYEQNDRPVTDVFAPDQNVSGGSLLLEIVDGRVGRVGFQNGDVFDDDLLEGAVLLQRGELLLASDLQAHLDWFNRNPFRSAGLYAAPGEEPGEADLVFAFEDRRPWRVYAAYENSGSEAAGENRYLAGFNWGNAFDLDHTLNYQFTTGDSLDELSVHAVTWEIPIHPWHHFIRFTGAYASISADVVSVTQQIFVEGSSWQIGASYGIPLARRNGFKREVTFGLEFKSSDNFVVFGGTASNPGSVVDVVQFRADYQASRQFDAGALELRASLIASPGGLTGNNEDADFERFRAGADSQYLVGRGTATWVQRLPQGWTLRANAKGQLATGPLLPAEQLALGGHASIRGYEERDFLADHGYALSAELRAPTIDFSVGELPAGVQFLGFVDHGTGWRSKSGNRSGRESFHAVGVGLRAQLGSYFNLRTDVAAPLEGGGVRAHIGATVSF